MLEDQWVVLQQIPFLCPCLAEVHRWNLLSSSGLSVFWVSVCVLANTPGLLNDLRLKAMQDRSIPADSPSWCRTIAHCDGICAQDQSYFLVRWGLRQDAMICRICHKTDVFVLPQIFMHDEHLHVMLASVILATRKAIIEGSLE